MVVISEATLIHKQRATYGLNVKGAYTALIDVARAQLNSDTQLTDEAAHAPSNALPMHLFGKLLIEMLLSGAYLPVATA